MIWDEFLSHFWFCDEEDSGLSDEEQERKGPKKIAQSTHENGYIQSGRTFCRNSKQLLSIQSADILVQVREFFLHLNFDYESHIYNKVYTVFQSLPSPPLFSAKVFK